MMGWFERFEREWNKALNEKDVMWKKARDRALDDKPQLPVFIGLKIGHFNDYAGLRITFPANTSRKDFERMKVEIQAVIDQAERRGEQKALAKIAAQGGG